MAKEFKQRTIKKNNNKYLKTSIVIASIITVLVVIIVLIPNKSSKNTQEDEKNSIPQTNIGVNTGIELDDTPPNITDTESNDILSNKQESTKRSFNNEDAVINGVQRNMNEEQVKTLLGIPETMYKEQSMMGYEVLIYTYNGGDTKVEFILSPNGQRYIVHRARTTNPNVILTRKLKIGDSTEAIMSAFYQDNILYKTDELIVVGYYGENPIYATSLQPKIYFTIQNNIITEVLISIGNES